MEQIFPPIDTHREKRVELGVLIEPTTSACYGGVCQKQPRSAQGREREV